MDLVYLMLNDKGQTESIQLLNTSGVPQVLDANDPLVSRLNTGPGSGKPVQVCNDEGETVEAMQLTEFHYFVNENNEVIPIPPGSIVQGEFEDEEVEDGVSLEVQNDACSDIHLSTEAVNNAHKETEIVLAQNMDVHLENFNVGCNEQELEQLQSPVFAESNASELLGSEDSQLNIQKDQGLPENCEFDQNVSETIFTPAEIELEEEVVSLQLSEPVAVAHRPSIKLAKKVSGSTSHYETASSTSKDAFKVTSAIFCGDLQGRSPIKKSKKKQVSIGLDEERSGMIEKTLLQQDMKNANPMVEESSLQSDSSFSETGRPRRSVARRSALEMLHGEGKTASRKHATSSGSDSELDVGSGMPSSGKRHNSKAVEKLEKLSVISRPIETATLCHAAADQSSSSLASNDNTELENISELNSATCAMTTDALSIFSSTKRGKGRPRKVTSINLLPSTSTEASDLIENKNINSLSYTLVNEPNNVIQQVGFNVSLSGSIPSVNEVNSTPVEQSLPFSVHEFHALEANSQKNSPSCASEALKTNKVYLPAYSGELCPSVTTDYSDETIRRHLKETSDEGVLCISEVQISMTKASLQSTGSMDKQLKDSEEKINDSLISDHLRTFHGDSSKLEASFDPSAVHYEGLKNATEARNNKIFTGKGFINEKMLEDPVSTGEHGIQDGSQNNASLNSLAINKSVSAAEEDCMSFHDNTINVLNECKNATVQLEEFSGDDSVKHDVSTINQLQVDIEKETDASDGCQKSPVLPVSQQCQTEEAKNICDVDCSRGYETCLVDVNEAGPVKSNTARDDELANADCLELHGRDEEDIHALEIGTYPEQDDVCECRDFDFEMENNSEQTDGKTEASGASSAHLFLDVLKNAKKTFKTSEEPVGLDNKTALLILAEIEHLASEIRSKFVHQESGEDSEVSAAVRSPETWKLANEKRLHRIVTNELMKLRALDEEVDQRSSQLVIARGQMSRREDQLKQQQLVLEQRRMVFDIEKEQFEEEQKKLNSEKEDRLHSELKESRKRLADSLAVPRTSVKKARISDTSRPSSSVKHRRPIFEEMATIKETKASTLSSKSSPPFKNFNVPISHQHSTSSLATLSVNDSKDTSDVKPKEVKLYEEEDFDKEIVVKLDSSAKLGDEKEIPTSSGASVVVKGKKELLRRFEADELNLPSEDLVSNKFAQKPMKTEASSCSTGNSSALKKTKKHSHGPTAVAASTKPSTEYNMPATSSKGGNLVKKSSSSESKSHSKNSPSTVRVKKHSCDSETLKHKRKTVHLTESRNLASPLFDGSKKKETKTQKRSL